MDRGKLEINSKLPSSDDSTIGSDIVWNKFKNKLNESVNAGTTFSKEIVSTYSLVYTTTWAYIGGGVLAPNGDIHLIPFWASVGQKININGVVSTYSLVFNSASSYYGGVLAPNGDIHFVPHGVPVGQKININGVVSTYSLVYTTENAYSGGVLDPNGNIHFINTGVTPSGVQKISTLPAKPFSLAMCCSSFLNKF